MEGNIVNIITERKMPENLSEREIELWDQRTKWDRDFFIPITQPLNGMTISSAIDLLNKCIKRLESIAQESIIHLTTSENL